MWLFSFCNNVVRFQDWLLKRRRFIPKGKVSKGERRVAEVLDKYGFCYETQYELGYYMHADFAVSYKDKVSIIEYDGRQHYHPIKYFGGWWKFFLQRLKDWVEKLECKDRNIPLLRIRYDVPFEKIEDIVVNFLKT